MHVKSGANVAHSMTSVMNDYLDNEDGVVPKEVCVLSWQQILFHWTVVGLFSINVNMNTRVHMLGGLHTVWLTLWLTMWHIAPVCGVTSGTRWCWKQQNKAVHDCVLWSSWNLAFRNWLQAICEWWWLCLDYLPVLQLMLFCHPQKSLPPISSTCPHSTLLATLGSSSHSIPRCHDLLFQPTLSQLLAQGLIQDLSTAGL